MSIEKSAVFVTIALSAVGVLADAWLKHASNVPKPLTSPYFYLGLVTYSSLAFGWVFVMRHLKLASIGVIYSVSTLLLLAAVGFVAFHETLRWQEVLGVLLAIASIALLARLA